MPFARQFTAAFLVLLAGQAQAQQPAAPHEARFTPQPAALNPQLMNDIHVPLLAVIDVLQQRQAIADALAQWESASQSALPMAPEDEHIAYMLQKSKRTGHEISVAIDLQSRVRAEELNKRFAWTTIEQAGNRIVLTAEPRETVEQLFYRGFELQLDAKTHLPVSIRFIDRSGKRADEPMQLSVKLKLDEPTEVTLASAEAAIEKRVIREPQRLVETDKANASTPIPSDIPADVAAFLNDWEAASAKQRTLETQFVRRVYDSVFRVEKLSTGHLYYESPNKGRIDVVEPELKSEYSARKDPSGDSYKLKADRPETWIWTQNAVMQINMQEKLVEIAKFYDGSTVEMRGILFSNMTKPQAVTPLVLDIRADDVKRCYQLKILQHNELGTWLEAKPRSGTVLAESFSLATVIVDSRTNLTRFARYVDPSGNIETVYSFENWKINNKRADKPLQPNLDGYRVNVRSTKNKPARTQDQVK